jgi:hypothetical protein
MSREVVECTQQRLRGSVAEPRIIENQRRAAFFEATHDRLPKLSPASSAR